MIRLRLPTARKKAPWRSWTRQRPGARGPGRTDVPRTMSFMGNPRVDQRVQQVNCQVDENEQQGGDHHRSLYYGKVELIDGLDHQRTEAGPGEHSLHRDRTA